MREYTELERWLAERVSDYGNRAYPKLEKLTPEYWLEDGSHYCPLPNPHTPTLAEIEAKAGERGVNSSLDTKHGDYLIFRNGWEYRWSEHHDPTPQQLANRRRALTLLTMGGDE